MGNIIGEGFKDYVIKQIDIRQKNLARQSRDTQLLQEQNSKSAWIKLTSSILISDRSKFNIPSNIDDLAKYFTLFGGTSINLNPLGGLGAYDKFGFEQGYRPMPGILSLETKNRNRGSVRETTVQMRAYSREQFYYIDLLYLRLGYSVLIEFGNSLYYDNRGNYQKFTDDQTVTSKFLGKESSEYKGDHYKLLQAIEDKRKQTAGNYDAIFGQIRNFDWSFTPDGYYDIILSIISYGDVVESLKANVQSEDEKIVLTEEEKKQEQKTQESLAKATTDGEVIDILKNIDVIGNLAWKIKRAIDTTTSVSNVGATGGVGAGSPTIILDKDNITLKSDALANTLFGADGYKSYDAIKVFNKEEKENTYYIRFGALLQYLWDTGMLYIDTEGVNPIVSVDLDTDSNLIYRTPYTVSSNPNICVIKTNLELNINGANFGTSILKDFPSEMFFNVDRRDDAGKVLNVYLNMAYVLKQCNDLRDNQNNIFFYDLIKKVCDSIGQCLGGVNLLEPVVDEQEARLYILDQHPIPSLQSEERALAEFSIYGLTPGKQGSFVTNFGINTSITNALASTVTIGAQANGAVKGADATAFANWNTGLVDRVMLYKKNKNSNTADTDAQTKLELRNRALQEEYYSFIQDMQKYKWTEAKTSEFQTILSNMISFTEAASGISGQGTKGGSLGFLPINLNLTFDGLAGMKIYQRFKILQDFLPYNYPNALQFIITGITHEISNNKWITKIDTNVVPETVTTVATQDFTGAGGRTSTSGTGTGTASTQNTGALGFPAVTSSGLRLRLQRLSDNGVQTTGELQLLSPSGAVLYSYNTVERPWLGNQSRVSCIPPGTYRFTKSKANNNPGLGDVLRLTNPPYRDGVLVHVGNKPTDSEGCILTQLKTGGSRAAMKQILDTLYPAGSAPETYTLEVYGVKNKSYVDIRDNTVYENPTTQPQPAELKKSRDLYIQYVGYIQKVMALQDNYALTEPLLQETVGTVLPNSVAEAAQRIRALFGDPNMNFNNRPAPWNNLFKLNQLLPKDKKLFRQELKNFTLAVSSRGASLRTARYQSFITYEFTYPDLGNLEQDKNEPSNKIPVTYG